MQKFTLESGTTCEVTYDERFDCVAVRSFSSSGTEMVMSFTPAEVEQLAAAVLTEAKDKTPGMRFEEPSSMQKRIADAAGLSDLHKSE